MVVESLGDSDFQVDMAKNVISGVKLIGFESRNNRSYSPNVLRQAVHLYEGVKVNLDHPHRPNTPRSVADRIGVIRRARFVEGKGVFGDFHFNPQHPSAGQIVWEAENNPSALGFSHNATLQVAGKRSGRQIVEAIAGVKSVDLVADPATTNGFFEMELPENSRSREEQADSEQPGDQQTDEPMARLSEMVQAALEQMGQILDQKDPQLPETITQVTEIASQLVQDLKTFAAEISDDDSANMESLTVSILQRRRPDLISQIQSTLTDQMEQLTTELQTLKSQNAIDRELKEAGLNPDNPTHVSPAFRTVLEDAASSADRQTLITDRLTVLEAGSSAATTRPVTTRTSQQNNSALTKESFLASLRRWHS